jgi:hypothetical protein
VCWPWRRCWQPCQVSAKYRACETAVGCRIFPLKVDAAMGRRDISPEIPRRRLSMRVDLAPKGRDQVPSGTFHGRVMPISAPKV